MHAKQASAECMVYMVYMWYVWYIYMVRLVYIWCVHGVPLNVHASLARRVPNAARDLKKIYQKAISFARRVPSAAMAQIMISAARCCSADFNSNSYHNENNNNNAIQFITSSMAMAQIMIPAARCCSACASTVGGGDGDSIVSRLCGFVCVCGV